MGTGSVIEAETGVETGKLTQDINVDRDGNGSSSGDGKRNENGERKQEGRYPWYPSRPKIRRVEDHACHSVQRSTDQR